MTRFMPRHLDGRPIDSANYALTGRSGTDLSLVTGPYMWRDLAVRCLGSIGENELRPYRKPAQDVALIEAIASRESLSPSQVWLVQGADHAIELVLNRFLIPGSRLGILVPCFPRFEIVAATIPAVDVQYFSSMDSIPADLSMAVLCTPCNPTTDELSEVEVRHLLKSSPDTLFCIDAVFSWYGSWNPAVLCREFDNVIVLKSYSKIGLAGLRMGYVVAPAEILAELRVGRSPFMVSAVSQQIGLAVEQSLSTLDDIHRWIREQMSGLRSSFGDRIGHGSPVPFYTLKVDADSTTAARILMERDVVVVDCAKFAGMPTDRLRIAIGSASENATLVNAISESGLVG